jgi:hypothetical protein
MNAQWTKGKMLGVPMNSTQATAAIVVVVVGGNQAVRTESTEPNVRTLKVLSFCFSPGQTFVFLCRL